MSPPGGLSSGQFGDRQRLRWGQRTPYGSVNSSEMVEGRLGVRPYSRELQMLMPRELDTSLQQIPVSPIPVVNVATVPQRSPLRYPGGKTWLVPHVRAWLSGIRNESR